MRAALTWLNTLRRPTAFAAPSLPLYTGNSAQVWPPLGVTLGNWFARSPLAFSRQKAVFVSQAASQIEHGRQSTTTYVYVAVGMGVSESLGFQ